MLYSWPIKQRRRHHPVRNRSHRNDGRSGSICNWTKQIFSRLSSIPCFQLPL